jgi:nucleoside-diphosphate-sugar epimerase
MQTSQTFSTAPFGATHTTWPVEQRTARRLKCVVTGGTGFVGRHLIEAIARRGDTPICLSRSSTAKVVSTASWNAKGLDVLDIEVRQADYRDVAGLKRALEGVDCLFHVAGVTKAFRGTEYEAGNHLASRNLFAAAVDRQTPPRIVLVSSLAAAGPATSDRPRTESEAPAPVSKYGQSKLAAEMAARQYAGWASIAIARPPIVFGPGERNMFAMVQSIARTGIHFVPGWRTRHYSLVHAQDFASALLRLADTEVRLPAPSVSIDDWSTGVYFVADEATPSYQDWGRMLGRAMGREPHVLMVPPRSIYVAAAFNEVWGRIVGEPHILNFDKAREGLAGSWMCDVRRVQQDLGWRPAASLEQRLGEAIAWFRQAGWL